MADNNKVYVGVVTVSGKVFQQPELREGKFGSFATMKVSRSNGKDKDGNWLPSTFFSVLLPTHVAVKKDTGGPSWLVQNLTKGTSVTLTGELEVGAYLDKTNQAQPQLNLTIGNFKHVSLHGGGEAASTSDDSVEEPPFLYH